MFRGLHFLILNPRFHLFYTKIKKWWKVFLGSNKPITVSKEFDEV